MTVFEGAYGAPGGQQHAAEQWCSPLSRRRVGWRSKLLLSFAYHAKLVPENVRKAANSFCCFAYS
jgi:hypothetical protein